MKGIILTINSEKGLIRGEDGKRYQFSLKEWKESFPPLKGMEVDFEADGENAKDIFAIDIPKNIETNISAKEKEILNQAGLYGGLGSIGILLSWVPFVGFIFSIVGIILLFVGVKKISDIDPSKQVFKSLLYAYLIPFAYTIIMSIILVILLPKISNSYYIDSTNLFLIFWVIIGIPVLIFMAIYFKKTFIGIYEITKNPTFKTCAEMFFWGELLSIIFIGVFIVLVAWILTAIAFFSLRK